VKTIPLDDCPAEMLDILNRARKCYDAIGEHYPALLFYYGEKKTCYVDVTEMMSHGQRGKDAVEVMLIGGVLRGALSVAFVAEAWGVMNTSGEEGREARELASEGRLKDHPDRREILSVMFESAEAAYFGQAEIVDKKLGAWQVYRNEADASEGRFVGIFAKAQQYRKENGK
jgi:hypothetical protein